MKINPEEIAQAYITAWENAWNNKGVEATVKLYALDGILIGYVTSIGQSEIANLLGGIHAQGWTKIKIKMIHAREINSLVLVANEYTAFGSGPNEGKTLEAKSSLVLVPHGDSWISIMHTAT